MASPSGLHAVTVTTQRRVWQVWGEAAIWLEQLAEWLERNGIGDGARSMRLVRVAWDQQRPDFPEPTNDEVEAAMEEMATVARAALEGGEGG